MQRLSLSLDQPLNTWEKVGYYVHHICCRRCRVSRTHFLHLDRNLKSLAKNINNLEDLQQANPQQVTMVKHRPEFLAELKEKLKSA